MKRRFFIIGVCAVVLFAHNTRASATDIKVLAGPAYTPAFSVLGPAFERATGNKLQIRYEISGPAKRVLDSGETFDVYILSADLLDYGIKVGKIAASSRTGIARVGMAVAARSKSPKPDISTAEAFKRMLVHAKSVTYPPEGFIGKHFAKIIGDMGIADMMKSKTKLQAKVTAVPQAVAAGEAEFGFAPQTILTSASGVEVVGPFPAELQSYIVYVAGIGSSTQQPDAAKSLLKSLTAPPAIAVLKEKGYDIGGR